MAPTGVDLEASSAYRAPGRAVPALFARAGHLPVQSHLVGRPVAQLRASLLGATALGICSGPDETGSPAGYGPPVLEYTSVSSGEYAKS